MKLAEDKHKVPVKPEAPTKSNTAEAEFDRPMTKKEKEEYLREQASKLRKQGKLPTKTTATAEQNSKKQVEAEAGEKKSAPEKKKEEEEAPTSVPKPKKVPVVTGPEFHHAVLKSRERERAR